MKRREAIKWLIKPTVTSTEISPTKIKELEAYNMAIEALSENNISKKEVINYARKCADGYSYIELPLDAFVDGINALSAEAEEAVLNKMLEEEMIVLPQDYVKVVRCKDCRYRKKVSTSYYCELDEFNVKDTDFCSWGERSEKE